MGGLPSVKQGLQDKDPTIAEPLKLQGYAPAQIGKNHLGERNEYLPTFQFRRVLRNSLSPERHGGAVRVRLSQDGKLQGTLRARNIVASTATSVDDPTTDPR
jgi:arylsulfatase A-like enzyme